MKANEMPERVYLFDYNDAMVAPLEGDTTYVREDTFIDRACEWLADNARAFDEGDIYNAEDLIEHFRKYMKGE